MALEVQPNMEVDRTKPHPELDGTDTDPRLSRYRELMVVPSVLLKHPLVDEGSYFVCNNAQSGLATAAAPTAFSATNPFLVIYNPSRPSDDFAQRIYLDYLALLATAAGTGATNVQFAITRDNGNRYVSGGTELTLNITNTGPTSAAAVAKIYAGNITASAASASAKTLIGNRVFKTGVAPIPTIGDEYIARFGSASLGENLVYSNAAATLTQSMVSAKNLPPIVLGSDESLLFHLWFTGQSAASSFAPELGWWER